MEPYAFRLHGNSAGGGTLGIHRPEAARRTAATPYILELQMRDLELYRRLVAGTATAAELAPAAQWSLLRRAPLIAHIAPLTAHADPAMRAAALAVLGGARGVPGVSAMVSALGDDDFAVRTAALEALRQTANGAPHRFAHALFHPSAEIRRAALAGPQPANTHPIAIHLRADRACADLTTTLPWPDHPLRLAFELHAQGHVTARELVALFLQQPISETRAYFQSRVAQRGPDPVYAFLDHCVKTGFAVAPGADVIDTLLAAIVEVGDFGRPLDRFVEMATPRTGRGLLRRSAVALIGAIARTRRIELVAACVGLEPRALGYPDFPRAWSDAAIAGLVDIAAKTGATADPEKLLALPIVREPLDLGLAAAIAALFPQRRLAKLAEVVTQSAILDSLVASDRGWDALCRLPAEKPALDLIWLSMIDSVDERRYVQLAGRAIALHTGDRLDAFVDQVQRRLRQDAFHVALTCNPHADREQLAATCRAVAPRVDRSALAWLLGALPDAPARELVRAATTKQLTSAGLLLLDDQAARLVAILDTDDPPPRDRELALAGAFAGRSHPAIAAWVEKVSTVVEPRVLVTSSARARRELDKDERDRIATCPPGELLRALHPVLAAPTRAMGVTGLCEALARRPASLSATVCAALLGCSDPLDDVCRELSRFGTTTPAFDAELDDAVAEAWLRFAELPPLAHARLWRWEQHSTALAEWCVGAGGVHAALVAIQTLSSPLARRTLWRGISEVVLLMRYRQPERFHKHTNEALAIFCAERVDVDIGTEAARILVTLVAAGAVPFALVRDRVLERVADAGAEARELLSRIVPLDGTPPPPIVGAPTEASLIARIRAAFDLGELAAWCADARLTVVQEAALALAARGEAGQMKLAELLDQLAALPHPIAIVQTVVLWDSERALAIARTIAARDLPPAWRFHLCLALADVPRALAAAREPDTTWGLRRADWDALCRIADPLAVSLALADSPHFHAYHPALTLLLPLAAMPEVGEALLLFLEIGDDRPRHLRVEAARRLAAHRDDLTGLPLLVEHACNANNNDWAEVLAAMPLRAVPTVIDAVLAAALIGGDGACYEKRMWAIVEKHVHLLPPERRHDLYARILDEASTAAVRRNAAPLAYTGADRRSRLRDVAEVFAWGVRRGVELAGRMFTIHLTSSERDFGHTRLDTNRIFVSPLPMLRGEANGADIVEGLVLHEIGHHVYHRGPKPQALWNRAHKEGLGQFLNLIADEHLERNLRAQDAAYGDRLKRLGAYAFQHAPQELKVMVLLDCLGAAAAPALIATPLEVAYDEQSLRLRRGAVLTELDRLGHPVARFSRALRMGLGNRHADPLIGQALALCKDIRSLDMQGLYDLTHKLAELFGGATELAKVFGGPEGLEFGERDGDVFGAGIDDDVLQKEVERILHPGDSTSEPGRRRRDRLQINVNPDEDFRKIAHIERVRGNVEDHRSAATDVARHAARLRAHLDELGLRWLPAHARTQGRALDRTRLRPLVTRLDPRILIAREPVRRTDLFLGTIVDCSGSMSAGDNIARARRFAILVAEAVKPLPGVEARFFGFTDSTIYDAGDKHDCHVTALEADGGNNDAAALYHVANVALAAPQRAKVIVMISDGLPTECSVPALRGLVTRLTKRKGIVCAQVAVRALEEVCFPHYVVLDDAQLDVAVARFGRMIGDLARKSLAS
jgi:hypothetical protein